MTDCKKPKPWETVPNIWKTEAAFMSYVRGGIRKSIWSRYPVKLEYIKQHRTRGINPKTGRECFGATCYLCGNFFPQAQLEVDHIVGNHSLKTIDDASEYLKEMLFVGFDDLALACKSCHKIKSYAEKQDISFEEAFIEKKTIATMKKPKTVVDKILRDNDLPSNNDLVRRKGLKKLIEEGKYEPD